MRLHSAFLALGSSDNHYEDPTVASPSEGRITIFSASGDTRIFESLRQSFPD
jgi:ABC-type molybdate transport system substrate-binding protein